MRMKAGSIPAPPAKAMTIKEITQEVWKREGKRIKVSIADCREIVAVLSDLLVEVGGSEALHSLIQNGLKRAKKKAVKKK